MKPTYYSSLFSVYAQIAGAISRADKNFNTTKPVFGRVGIKFDNISDGKLYLSAFIIKNIHGLRQKDKTSHP
jgi:hypothetical protein